MNGVANLALVRESNAGEIAFIDLKAQQRLIRERIEARLRAVLDHGRYIGGPEIEELEEKLAARTGAKAAVACASGTAALIIPLLAKGIDVGDAVFIPAFSFNATANAVLLAGATPVFVDIDPGTFNMSPGDLARQIEETRERGVLRPRAVIPVDLFGSPADYDEISAIARREDLFLLSDAAQSFGGRLHNRWVGNIAPATATSFFPGKSLGAYGDAGGLFTQDPSDAEVWSSIRWHGTESTRKISDRVGFNARMDSFQAAILLEKMELFDVELESRHRIAAIYNERLGRVARLQRHSNGAVSSYGYYSICIRNRDQVAEWLNANGVPTAIYYATPLHKMPAFASAAPAEGLPVTERICNEILSLPMHPYLTPVQIEFICGAVESAVSSTS